MRSTKDDLKELTTKYVFDSITEYTSRDIDPIALYLPERRKVKASNYGYNAVLFDGEIPSHFEYFFNLKYIPPMAEYYLRGRSRKVYANYFLTLSNEKLNIIKSASILYFGFLVNYHVKLCKLFLKEDYRGIVDTFREFFKRLPGEKPVSELCYGDIRNIFGFAPHCGMLIGQWDYYSCATKELDFKGFYLNILRMSSGPMFHTGRRRYNIGTDINLNKSVVLLESEIELAHDSVKQFMPKVQHSLLMLGFAFHKLGTLPKEDAFYSEFKNEESVQCQTQPGEVTCSNSQEDRQPDQQ